MIEAKKKTSVLPFCPHCSELQTEVWFSTLKTGGEHRDVYFCAAWQKVLGFSR